MARLREQGVGCVGLALRFPGRFGLVFGSTLCKDAAVEQSAHAAFDALERALRQLFDVSGSAPLAPAHADALMSVWSVVQGFANLSLSGQFDHLRPGGEREDWQREVLAPMLEQRRRPRPGT